MGGARAPAGHGRCGSLVPRLAGAGAMALRCQAAAIEAGLLAWRRVLLEPIGVTGLQVPPAPGLHQSPAGSPALPTPPPAPPHTPGAPHTPVLDDKTRQGPSCRLACSAGGRVPSAAASEQGGSSSHGAPAA